MGKKRTSSSSENEKTNIKLHSSKKQINQTSKKQLLKSGLNNNKVQHIFNRMTLNKDSKDTIYENNKSYPILQESQAGSDSNESIGFQSENRQDSKPKRKKHKIQKRRQEEVSSSSESEEETKASPSSDNEGVNPIIRKRVPIPESENNSLNIQPEKNDFNIECLPMVLQNIKTNVSSSEDEEHSNLIDGINQKIKIKHKGTFDFTSKSKANRSHKYLSKNKNSVVGSSSDEYMKESPSRQTEQISANIDSDEGSNILQETLHGSKKTVESIEERIGKHSHSERLSNTSFKNKLKSPKERLEQMYPGIKEIKNNMALDFSATEDIYLFRVPKNVDPSTLQNVEISLEEKCKINIGGKYNIEPTPNKPQPTLVLSDNCNIIDFKGNIRMEKYIKSKKEPNIVISEKVSVPLPDNLKKRHPLFGSNYRQKIKLSEEVEKKLDDAIESLLKKEKNSKKKKRRQIKIEEGEEIQKEEIFTLLKNHSVADSNKKIKKEISDDSAVYCSSSTEQSKDISNYSHDIINETLNEIKSEIFTENESDHLEYPSKKKKKNKSLHGSWEEMPQKRKSKKYIDDEINSAGNKSNITISTNNLNEATHNRLLVNSTLISDMQKTPSFNPEVSRITFDETNLGNTSKKSRKGSKSDEKRILTENQLISGILESLKDDLSPKKVKKKRTRESE